MKVFVEVDDKYILLEQDKDYSNFETDSQKTYIINEAMDMLENKKMNMEIAKQRKGDYLVKKLDKHPRIGKMRYW